MNQPFFSIILPVYNAQDSLDDCLDSILNQSFQSFELVIVNDGSTDQSRRVIMDFLKDYPATAFQLFDQENQGLGASRNKAIMEAKGKYCALIDADDLWDENKLASCHEYLRKDPDCDVLYHAVDNFGLKGESSRNVYPIQKAEDILEKGLPIVPSAALIKRQTALAHPFQIEDQYHGAEDLFLWLELWSAGKKFCYWPEAKSYYREDGGMSSRIEEHLKKVEAVYDHFHEGGLYPRTSLERAMQRKFYEAARFCQKRGLHHRAHHYYAAADSRSIKVLGLRLMNFFGLKW